jgi:hypothetical protein
LFYPGNELFINPYGFGGPALGRPQDGAGEDGSGRSLANILGLGGYHTIISIKSTITPGDYSTTIQAQQYYTGDGSGNPNLNGKKRLTNLKKEKEKKLEDKHTTGDSPTGDACNKIIVDTLYADVLINESQRLRAGERPYIPPTPPTPPSPPVESPDFQESEVPNTEADEITFLSFDIEVSESLNEGFKYKTAFRPTELVDGNIVPTYDDGVLVWTYDYVGPAESSEDGNIKIYEYFEGKNSVATIFVYTDAADGFYAGTAVLRLDGVDYTAVDEESAIVGTDPYPSNPDDETDIEESETEE